MSHIARRVAVPSSCYDSPIRVATIESHTIEAALSWLGVPRMKIAIITDAHANLPALQAALQAIKAEGVDEIYHTGDAVGIGPFPAETLDLLLETPGMRFVMGDYDAYFVDGLPETSQQAFEPQQGTNNILDPSRRETLAAWPYVIETEIEDVSLAFVHYALNETGRGFLPPLEEATAEDLDKLFERHETQLVFYGHVPGKSAMQGRAMYINPGSLGCQSSATANYSIIDVRGGNLVIDHHQVMYDDSSLYEAFEKRAVPGRVPFYQVFFGGRFGGR